jgi:hypothetical protein
MERFIAETFGAKPLIEASKVLHDAQALVDELKGSHARATERRIGALLSRLDEMAHLHQWLDEADVIASIRARRARSRTVLQRQLRAGLRDLEVRLHDRLLGAVVTRLESRRR